MKPSLLLSAASTITITIALLAGCSSGGDGVERNRRCKLGYDPMSAEATKDYLNVKKIEKTDDIEPSEFTYSGSQLYFHDKSRDLHLHIAHNPAEAGQPFNTKAKVVCARGIKPNMERVEYSVLVAAAVVRKADGSSQIKTMKYNVVLDPKHLRFGLEAEVEPPSELVEGSPLELHPEFNSNEQYLMTTKKRPKDRELISRLKGLRSKDNSGDADDNIVIRAKVDLKNVAP
jgi:hypothetical protein